MHMHTIPEIKQRNNLTNKLHKPWVTLYLAKKTSSCFSSFCFNSLTSSLIFSSYKAMSWGNTYNKNSMASSLLSDIGSVFNNLLLQPRSLTWWLQSIHWKYRTHNLARSPTQIKELFLKHPKLFWKIPTAGD